MTTFHDAVRMTGFQIKDLQDATEPTDAVTLRQLSDGLVAEVEVEVGPTRPTDPGNDLWVNTAEDAQGLSGDAHYVHVQATLALTWTVRHGLGKHPSVVLADAGGTVLWAEVRHIDENELTVTFASAATGTAYCN